MRVRNCVILLLWLGSIDLACASSVDDEVVVISQSIVSAWRKGNTKDYQLHFDQMVDLLADYVETRRLSKGRELVSPSGTPEKVRDPAESSGADTTKGDIDTAANSDGSETANHGESGRVLEERDEAAQHKPFDMRDEERFRDVPVVKTMDSPQTQAVLDLENASKRTDEPVVPAQGGDDEPPPRVDRDGSAWRHAAPSWIDTDESIDKILKVRNNIKEWFESTVPAFDARSVRGHIAEVKTVVDQLVGQEIPVGNFMLFALGVATALTLIVFVYPPWQVKAVAAVVAILIGYDVIALIFGSIAVAQMFLVCTRRGWGLSLLSLQTVGCGAVLVTIWLATNEYENRIVIGFGVGAAACLGLGSMLKIADHSIGANIELRNMALLFAGLLLAYMSAGSDMFLGLHKRLICYSVSLDSDLVNVCYEKYKQATLDKMNGVKQPGWGLSLQQEGVLYMSAVNGSESLFSPFFAIFSAAMICLSSAYAACCKMQASQDEMEGVKETFNAEKKAKDGVVPDRPESKNVIGWVRAWASAFQQSKMAFAPYILAGLVASYNMYAAWCHVVTYVIANYLGILLYQKVAAPAYKTMGSNKATYTRALFGKEVLRTFLQDISVGVQAIVPIVHLCAMMASWFVCWAQFVWWPWAVFLTIALVTAVTQKEVESIHFGYALPLCLSAFANCGIVASMMMLVYSWMYSHTMDFSTPRVSDDKARPTPHTVAVDEAIA